MGLSRCPCHSTAPSHDVIRTDCNSPAPHLHLEGTKLTDHVSSLVKHFPSDTCPSAPVTADDCSCQSLLLQTAQFLKPEESLRSSGPKGRHTYLQAFSDIIQNHGADGKPSFFTLPRSHSSYLVYLEKSHLPHSLCLRVTRAFIAQALIGTLH